MKNRPVIEADNLFFRYKDSTKYTLNGVSLKVYEGEFITIVGPNGSGKTTLALSLTGIIPHYIDGEYRGRVIVDGVEVSSSSIPSIATKVGFIMEDHEMQIVGITVRDDVAFGPCNLGLPRDEVLRRVRWALETVGLQGYEDRITYTLSSGEKQRLAIAGVLALDPKIVVADEPTSHLDPVGRVEFFRTLSTLNKRFRKTVVVFTHDLGLAMKYSDRVGLMYSGNIVFICSPEELASRLRVEVLLQYGIRLPQVLYLYEKLGRYTSAAGGGRPWLSVEDALSTLKKLVKGADPGYGKVEKSYGSVVDVGKEPVIVVEDLWYTYPGGIEALKGVSLTVNKGDFVAIVGSNGSGKTTLVKHFNGLLKPTKGRVMVCGVDTREKDVVELSQKVGYLFQNPEDQIIFSITVRENIALGLRDKGLGVDEVEKRVDWVLDLLGIEYLENEFPSRLSKTERRLLALASVLAMKTDILVVDEPTSGLDWKETKKVMNVLKTLNDLGHTVILVTHDMEVVAEYARKVAVMHRGRVLAYGVSRDILYNEDTLSQASLEPPPIVKLTKNCCKSWDSFRPLTVDEVIDLIIR